MYKPGDLSATKKFLEEKGDELTWEVEIKSTQGTDGYVNFSEIYDDPKITSATILSVVDGNNNPVQYQTSGNEIILPQMGINSTYKVQVSTKLNGPAGPDTIKNKAHVESTDSFGEPLVVEPEATRQGKTPTIQKQGEYTDDFTKVKWTITLNTNHEELGDMWLEDLLQDTSSSDSNKKDEISLSGATLSPDTGYKIENGRIVFDKGNKNDYTITVYTDAHSGADNEHNDIYLKRNKPDNPGETVAHDDASVQLPEPGLTKSGVVDGSDDVWTIVVNSEHRKLSGWTLYDYLLEDDWNTQRAAVSLSDATISPADGFTRTGEGGKDITFTDEAGTREYTITVRTPADETRRTEINRAYLQPSNPYKSPKTATAQVEHVERISKWANNYNEETRSATFVVQVNPYYVDMSGYTLTDSITSTLPTGWTIKNIHVKVNDANDTPYNTIGAAIDAINQGMNSEEGKTAWYLLYYDVEVPAGTEPGTSFTNIASVTKDGRGQSDTGTMTVTKNEGNYVQKNGNIENGRVKWTININSNYMDMTGWTFGDTPDASVGDAVQDAVIRVNDSNQETVSASNITELVAAVNAKIGALTANEDTKRSKITVEYYTPADLTIGVDAVNTARVNDV